MYYYYYKLTSPEYYDVSSPCVYGDKSSVQLYDIRIGIIRTTIKVQFQLQKKPARTVCTSALSPYHPRQSVLDPPAHVLSLESNNLQLLSWKSTALLLQLLHSHVLHLHRWIIMYQDIRDYCGILGCMRITIPSQELPRDDAMQDIVSFLGGIEARSLVLSW